MYEKFIPYRHQRGLPGRRNVARWVLEGLGRIRDTGTGGLMKPVEKT
jgi:hypothetical protein